MVSRLRFQVAEYLLDGTFLGFEDLSDQLILCAKTTEELERIYDIGTTVRIECTYDLSNLNSPNVYEVPRNANRFYELFLIDYNGNFIDVPVLI